jgi:L-rhamnose isomerase
MAGTYDSENVLKRYERARDLYRAFGVETDEALRRLSGFTLSLQCWQGDDVKGFESGTEGSSGGGILATGGYPGRARSAEELRSDLDLALSLIPGRHKVNLHAMYAETGGTKVDRDALLPEHFSNWISWAKSKKIGLDFNPTFFAHPLADSGFTLSSRDKTVRSFWIRHGKASRVIADAIGRELGKPCVNNLWIPDGSKDLPANRLVHRTILRDALDEVYAGKFDGGHLVDAVESKLFGIGSEAYVVGSHEFYMGYAMTRRLMLCLDAGHFHPTESIADKISAILCYADRLLLHVSRGVRWDSDHVVILTDDLRDIAREVKRADAFDRVFFALDFFDASINRITAWVTGARATLKSVLLALLEPTGLLETEERAGNLGARLALFEEFKALPFGAVWDKFCLDNGVPAGAAWLERVSEYETAVFSKR